MTAPRVIAVLVCPAGHTRSLPFIDHEVMSWLRKNVEKRIPRCDKCQKHITSVREEWPS